MTDITSIISIYIITGLKVYFPVRGCNFLIGILFFTGGSKRILILKMGANLCRAAILASGE